LSNPTRLSLHDSTPPRDADPVGQSGPLRDHMERETKPRRLRKIAAVMLGLYWVALFILLHIPIQSPVKISNADKVAHLVLYGTLATLLCLWMATSGRLTWKRMFQCYAFLAIYAVVDELLQIPVGRSCEAADWLADMIGIGLAFLIAMGMQRFLLRGLPLAPLSSPPETATGR
jgi:VanZ family protein